MRIELQTAEAELVQADDGPGRDDVTRTWEVDLTGSGWSVLAAEEHRPSAFEHGDDLGRVCLSVVAWRYTQDPGDVKPPGAL